MANVANPVGAIPCTDVRRITEYTKNTTKIYPGDFVVLNAQGVAGVAAAGDTSLIGVAANYATAGATKVLVYDDPDQQFYIQDDGVSGTLAQTSCGLNADLVATAGNATLIRSRHSFDTNNIQTTAANLRLLGFHPDDTIGKYVRCRVVINEHAWAKKTTGL